MSALPNGVDLAGLLADARFGDLLRLATERGLTRAEFDALPDERMPAGLTRAEARSVVTAILRRQAVYYYDTCRIDGRDYGHWYFPTRLIDELLFDISARTRVGSPLDAALHERHGRRFIVRSLIEETVAALSCDGLPVDYESACAVIAGERLPATPAERLVSNAHALLTDIVDGDAPPVTRGLVDRMHACLMDGVEEAGLHGGLQWGLEWPEEQLGPDELFDELVAMASGELVDPGKHPVILGQELTCKFWKNPPYAACNYMLGSLLTRLYMKRAGYPVFAYLPSSALTLEWKAGDYADGRVRPYHESISVTAFDWDATVYWESCLALIQRAIDDLERYVFALKASDDALLARLRDDHGFNHRQREVLARAILVPETTFRIEEHRVRHDLAYSTARQDLLTLAERGLLEVRYESKAQVFVARRDLKAALARRYEG